MESKRIIDAINRKTKNVIQAGADIHDKKVARDLEDILNGIEEPTYDNPCQWVASKDRHLMLADDDVVSQEEKQKLIKCPYGKPAEKCMICYNCFIFLTY